MTPPSPLVDLAPPPAPPDDSEFNVGRLGAGVEHTVTGAADRRQALNRES